MLEGILKSRNNTEELPHQPSQRENSIFSEMPLSFLKSGDIGTVLRLEGGEEFRSKMLALGIIPGKSVTVARGEKHQPYILRVDESRVMIDWKTLERIYIRPGTARSKGGFWR